MPECDIFREQLAIKYPLYGHALWEPSPRYPNKPVQVGDVGFIREGKFRRLFNALLPENDPSHECGVPECHEPLVPSLPDHLEIRSLARNHYCSTAVSVEPDAGYHSRPGDIPQATFKYNRTRGAAVLSLPVTARREDTLALGDFKLWIVKHIDIWFAFARRLGLGIERMEEIILVTGCDRTKSWANIAFFGNQADSHVSFGVRVENPDPTITFQFSPENAQGAMLHHGPEGENLPENQCVFIRGYRVARSLWKLPRQRLKAAAGPSPDPDGHNFDPDMEVISIPAISKYRDPLYVLLDYIAEQASDCDMVLAHDDDLLKIDGLGHDSSLETLEPDVIMNLLRRSNMEIHKVPCVSATDCGPNIDTSVVKIAMVSMKSQDRASLTPGFPSFRTTTPFLTPTPFPNRFSIEGVSARLSPTIITRQPQHPILSLPPISPTSSPAGDPRHLRSRSLRSVPALPMQGSDDQESAEHDNAYLDDLDEDDEGIDEDTEEETPEVELPDTASEDGESTSDPHSSGVSESRRSDLPATVVTPLDTEEPESQLGLSLRQRLSMPTFGPSTAPPPYPGFRFGERGIKIQGRDGEGCEHLPRYTNDIYLRAIMLRKMEYSAPGVQARDRKWRRILCILEGTAFRVYRCPPTATGKGVIGNLWEKTVGVGDISVPVTHWQENSTSAKMKERFTSANVKGKEPEHARRTKNDGMDNTSTQSPQSPASPKSQSATGSLQSPNDSDALPSPSSTRSRLVHQRFRRKSHAVSVVASDGPSTSRPELQTPRSPRIKRRYLWVDDPDVPLPQEQYHLHSYALHNAESGLGIDYVKRPNVIRVRMEGQQFLLQAPDVTSVVDWVEGFQAAANIAQDLDDRRMPKGRQMFPRRRQRRVRVQATS